MACRDLRSAASAVEAVEHERAVRTAKGRGIVAVRLTESAYDDPGSTVGSASSDDRVKLRHVLGAARPAVWLSLASKMAARRSVGRIGPAS